MPNFISHRTIRLIPLFLLTFPIFAATITVTGTGDPIAVDGACVLREAITAANTNAASGDCPAGNAGLDRIEFSIGGGGYQLIPLLSPLPDITDPLTIDGTTQPGFAGVPLIELRQAHADVASTLVIATSGGGTTIRGLVFSNALSALAIEVRSSSDNVIAGNYLGINQAGTGTANNGGGIAIVALAGQSASNNTIGGAAAADRNVISGNFVSGISIAAAVGGTVDGNDIVGNYIGWNPAKTSTIGNLGPGIQLSRATNTNVSGNAITGNLVGVSIDAGSNNVVQSNEIESNSGSGVAIFSSSDTIIGASTSGGPGGNTIENNGNFIPNSAGVHVFSGTGNRISGNSMSFNNLLGIDLAPNGANANDACDPDTGANQLQNKPVLTNAIFTGGTVTISGSLNSIASSTYTIDFYTNPPASFDQGFQYLGSTVVTTDASCNAQFTTPMTFTPPVDGYDITATAIDSANNTSEMSAPVFIIEPLTVAKAFAPTAIDANNAGSTSRLTVTLTNPNVTTGGFGNLTGVAFTDNYPAGLVNASTPNVTSTCGGSVTAAAGGSSLSLSGGALTEGQSCTVAVDVVLTTDGPHLNTIPAGGAYSTGVNATTNTEPVSATLDSVLDPPAVAKAFTPDSIPVGAPAQLSITLTNINTIDITGVAFTDTYPAGLVNATSPNVTNTCGGTVTADAEGTFLQLSGGTIPASGNCTITVNVVATTEGTLVNDLPAGSVTSANAPPSGAAATAALVAAATVAVPLSPSALLLLSMILAFAGALVVRRM